MHAAWSLVVVGVVGLFLVHSVVEGPRASILLELVRAWVVAGPRSRE